MAWLHAWSGLAGPAGWEVRAFFAAWLLAVVAAALCPRGRAWPVGLGVSAGASSRSRSPTPSLSAGRGSPAAMLALPLALVALSFALRGRTLGPP